MSDTRRMARPINIKDILKSAHILLQPPADLPTDPAELQKRVFASWKLLPHTWDEGLRGFSKTTRSGFPDGEAQGEDVGSLERGLSDLTVGEEASETSLSLGVRCLDLLLGLQNELVKEFWPAEVRKAESRDFILGTADLRLIRILLVQSLTLLREVSSTYLTTLLTSSPASPPPSNPPLKPVLLALLALLRPTPSPTPSLSKSGPSDSTPVRHLPPTTITQILLTSHLPPILLSTILLGYTPSLPPPTHAQIRHMFVSTLSTLPPAQALLALSGVLSLIPPRKSKETFPTPGPASITEIDPSPSPTLSYPPYLTQITHRQLSLQLLRPTGPLGLLLNIFGERALSDAEPVDERKVLQATEVLRRLPSGVEERVYVRHVTRECLDLLGLPKNGGKEAPRAFRAVSGGVIGRWLDKPAAGEVLDEAFESLRMGSGAEEEEKLSAISLLDMLIGYTDPAHLPRLLEIALQPILAGLRHLASPPTSSPSASKSDTPEAAAPDSDPEARIASLAQDILDTWERITSPRKP